MDELSDALEHYSRDPNAKAPVCLVICPQIESIPPSWVPKISPSTKVLICNLDTKQWSFDNQDFDAHAEQEAAIPYTENLYRGLGVAGLRLASYASRRPFKVSIAIADRHCSLAIALSYRCHPDVAAPHSYLQAPLATLRFLTRLSARAYLRRSYASIVTTRCGKG